MAPDELQTIQNILDNICDIDILSKDQLHYKLETIHLVLTSLMHGHENS